MLQKDYVDPIRYLLRGRRDFFVPKAESQLFPKADFYEEGPCTICFIGADEACTNGVWQHSPQPMNEEQINRILEPLFRKKVSFSWWESPILFGKEEPFQTENGISPTGKILIQQGFHHMGMLTGICAKLGSVAPKDCSVPGVSIAQAVSSEEIKLFCDSVFSYFEVSPDSSNQMFEILSKSAERGEEKYYVAYLDGMAVGGVSLAYGQHSAGLWNFAVHPHFRKRGIGSALLQAALMDAKKMGYREVMAFLYGERLSELWRQFQFQNICEFPYYIHNKLC